PQEAPHRLAPLEREPDRQADEDDAGEALEPAPRALHERRELLDRVGVGGQPHQAERNVDRREEQRPREHVVAGVDELRQERDVEEGDLRIEHVVEEALNEWLAPARTTGPGFAGPGRAPLKGPDALKA